MRRLPFVHERSSHATAVTVVGRELHLEPVRISDGLWCVRRNSRLVLADPDEIDAFVMPDKTVDAGSGCGSASLDT